MRRGLIAPALAVVAWAWVATAAGASSVPRVADAGPAFAGDDLVWGEVLDDGRSRVVRWAPGSGVPPFVVAEQPERRGPGRERSFGGIPGALDASATRVAWVRSDLRVVARGSDYVDYVGNTRVFAGPLDGPFTAPLGGCRGQYSSVAVDGDTVVAGSSDEQCGSERTATGRVWQVEAGLPPRVLGELREGESLRQVRIAGAWVAWATHERLVVAERATGRVAARWRRADLGGADSIDEFDLGQDGSVVVLLERYPRPTRLVRRALGSTAPSIVAPRRASTSVAVDGDRVAFLRRSGTWTRDLVVTTLDGALVRRLDRLRRHESLQGDLAFSDGRLAWSIAPDEAPAPGRRVLRVQDVSGVAVAQDG